MKVPAWLALLGVCAVLVAAGIFFASQGLGAADQYASVASFFLALVGAAVSVVSRLRSRARTPAPAEPPPDAPKRGGWTVTLLWRNRYVQAGRDNVNVMNVDNRVDPARRRNPRK